MADEYAARHRGRRAKTKKVRTHPRPQGFDEGSVKTPHPGVKKPKPPKPRVSPAHGKGTGPRPSASAYAHASSRAAFKRPTSTTATPTSPAAPRGARGGSGTPLQPRPRPGVFKSGTRSGSGTPLQPRPRPGTFKPGTSAPRVTIPENTASMPKPIAVAGTSTPKPPRDPGKSAFAPGQIKKRTGAKNASSIARARKG